jgi:fatty acid-binding protein DegV
VANELLVVDLGPVVGTHAGPGTIGVSYQLPPDP